MDQDLEVAHEVLRCIRQLIRQVAVHSKYLGTEAGLTLPQLVCLKAVGELQEKEAEVTIAMISAQVRLSAATVSRIIERLYRAGLVARERRSRDRRKVCLTLTPAGGERFRKLPTPLQERFVEGLMKLEPDERMELLQALRRISELMDASDLDAAPLLTPGPDVKTDSEM